jgi:mannose-6-phosphate isomerase-like protein (cupin superfamily)
MISTSEAYEFLSHELLYEQKLVRAIDAQHLQHDVNSLGDLIRYRSNGCSIKVEGMERFSVDIFHQGRLYAKSYLHNGPVTCHMFISPAGSPSFPMHTDPDHVVIHCCEGIKRMIVQTDTIDLHPGSYVYIPYGTPHMALNEYDALTLSFGLERFLKDKMYELYVLSQDHRDV